jgi:hypothetical protein
MNKKIFGIRLGTIVTVVLALITALILWCFVNYPEEPSAFIFSALNGG